MEFKPRWEMPDPGNKFYTNYTAGGINSCIKVDGNSCLPNCVGYAHGRVLEILGIDKQTWSVPACNAEDWWSKSKQLGYKTGQTPEQGAVMVWSVGQVNNGNDGCGHVAIVEQVNSDGSIWVSDSGYKSFYFRVRKLRAPYNSGNYKFLGFIYTEYVPEEKPVTEGKEYTVVKGDTLWTIASRFLGNGNYYKKIVEYNNLTTTTIYPGQVLKIPS